MNKLTLLTAAILFTTLSSFAQWGSGVILKSGDLKSLKSQKDLKVEYDYSNMGVGDFKTEDEYVNKKVKENNDKEKGKGDKWKVAWIGARKDRYQPKFEELFNKIMESVGTTISENTGKAKYTLIVKTVFTEPGFNIGIMKKPAAVNFDFLIVETDTPANVIAELYMKNVPGSQAMGFDYDSGSRIAESYAKGGKSLGKFIIKALKK